MGLDSSGWMVALPVYIHAPSGPKGPASEMVVRIEPEAEVLQTRTVVGEAGEDHTLHCRIGQVKYVAHKLAVEYEATVPEDGLVVVAVDSAYNNQEEDTAPLVVGHSHKGIAAAAALFEVTVPSVVAADIVAVDIDACLLDHIAVDKSVEEREEQEALAEVEEEELDVVDMLVGIAGTAYSCPEKISGVPLRYRNWHL